MSVALGQDHTLALTSTGEVVSWGLNRFAQSRYVVESGQGGSADESIQTTPRKIGHMKKAFLKGIAACKTASTRSSESDVWTWGTNGEQLGTFTFVYAAHYYFYKEPARVSYDSEPHPNPPAQGINHYAANPGHRDVGQFLDLSCSCVQRTDA